MKRYHSITPRLSEILNESRLDSKMSNKESVERQLFNQDVHEEFIKTKRSSQKVKLFDLIPQLVASCSMYLLVVQAGINMSFASVLISQLGDEQNIEIDINTSSIIASIWSIALPFGSISSGILMDRFGRKKVGLMICIPFFIAWLLISFAKNIYMIYISRTLAGVCCGLTSVSIVYTAEISYKSFRSTLLCMNSVWVSFGIFITYFLNFFHLNWRYIGWVYAIISILSMIFIFFIPESPHWILHFNKRASNDEKKIQLKKCISWLYRFPDVASLQYKELMENKELNGNNEETNQNEQSHWIKGIKRPEVYKPLITLIILFLLQQLSGGYVLIFYTINIFRNLGSDFLSSVDENLATLLLGTIRLIMAIIAAILSQKCGRKTLLYISTIGMTIFAYIAAVKMLNINRHGLSLFLKPINSSQIAFENDESSNFGNYFLLTSILAYILFASLGLLIIPWTCIAELFPIKYKANFGGLTVAIAYILMSLILKFFPFLLETIEISLIFCLFGSSSLLCCIFVFFYIPETHRKTFTEIENYFVKKNGARD